MTKRIKNKRSSRPVRDALKKKQLRRKIHLFGDPVLYRPCVKVKRGDDEIPGIIADMMQIARACPECVGLSANQVGFDKHIMVVKFPGMKDFIPMINVEIQHVNQIKEGQVERCLSFPGKSMWVERPVSILYEWYDESSELRQSGASGLDARIILHELDHLNGKPKLGRLL